MPATLQIGEPAYLVERLHRPVVSNFRAADLAAGGQGAPLATLFHRVVFAQSGKHVCVNNLGGISNVTSIDRKNNREPAILAFDTGPANILIDLAIQQWTSGRKRMDRNGSWAKQGAVSDALLSGWLKHPFFIQRPPKSTGREMFGEGFLETVLNQMQKARLSRFDLIATLTEFTARSLVLNCQRHLPSLPDIVVLTGGGAANGFLRGRITEQLQLLSPSVTVQTTDDYGWPAQSVEAAAFALLAYYRIRKIPGNIPVTTGAERAVLLGQVSEDLPC
jgi:anhydro-N-acetylmuramic acid kinase